MGDDLSPVAGAKASVPSALDANFLAKLAGSEQQSIVRFLSVYPRSQRWYDMLRTEDVDQLYSDCSPLLEAFQGCVPHLKVCGLETHGDDHLRNHETMGFSKSEVLMCAGDFLRELCITDDMVRALAREDNGFERLAERCTSLDNVTLAVNLEKLHDVEEENVTAARYAAFLLPLASALRYLTVESWMPEIFARSIECCEQLKTLDIRMFWGSYPDDTFWERVGTTLERLVISGFCDTVIEGAVIESVPKYCRKLNYIGIPAHSPLAHSMLLECLASYGPQLLKAHVLNTTPEETSALLSACPNVRLALAFDTKADAKPVVDVASRRAFRIIINGVFAEGPRPDLLRDCDGVEELTFREAVPDHFNYSFRSLKHLDVSVFAEDLSGRLVRHLSENTGSLEECSITNSWALPLDLLTFLQANKKLSIFLLTVRWYDEKDRRVGASADVQISNYLATLAAVCSKIKWLDEVHLDVRSKKGHGKMPIVRRHCQRFRTRHTLIRVCGVEYFV